MSGKKYPLHKYNSKRSPSKKTYRRKKAYNVNYPLATTVVKKLKYVESFNLNPSAGLFASYLFPCNGLYDPNASATLNHQPYSFDQLMQFYNHYIVIGAKIRVTAFQVTGGAPFTLCIKVDDDALSTGALFTELMEQPYMKRTYSIDTQKPARLVQKFSAKKFYGGKNILGDDAFRGTSSSNPSELTYFIVGIGPVNETADVGSISCIAEIEYIVKFIEPKTLVQS